MALTVRHSSRRRQKIAEWRFYYVLTFERRGRRRKRSRGPAVARPSQARSIRLITECPSLASAGGAWIDMPATPGRVWEALHAARQ